MDMIKTLAPNDEKKSVLNPDQVIELEKLCRCKVNYMLISSGTHQNTHYDPQPSLHVERLADLYTPRVAKLLKLRML